MLYLIFSIICSVLVGVIFKVARKYKISVTQIATYNYGFALLLCYLFFEPKITDVTPVAPWALYTALIVLLPTILLLMVLSIKHMGIVKTDAAQRLSLFIPILAACLIFHEAFNNYKLIGLLIGLPALVLILYKRADKSANKWLYPTLVLLGFGTVDVLFKQVALYKQIPYTTSLFVVFCGSLVVAVLYALYAIIFKQHKIKIINLAFGILVGIFNFGNILFYMRAHKAFAENPSTVFAGMNMGVIVLGSFVGVVAFKEKLSKINYLGIFLALVAIVFITLSQLKK